MAKSVWDGFLGGNNVMTTISAAFDNIRLLRRKIRISEVELEDIPVGSQRDASLIRLTNLTRDLVCALHEFAELGHEEEVARHLAPPQKEASHVQTH